MIEAGGVAVEMPLADKGGRIARLLQQFGERLLAAIKLAVAVVVEAVAMRILAGQDGRPTGPADGIGDQAAVEPHSLASQSVHVGRFEQPAFFTVRADGLTGQVVREDEQDVRLPGVGGVNTVA